MLIQFLIVETRSHAELNMCWLKIEAAGVANIQYVFLTLTNRDNPCFLAPSEEKINVQKYADGNAVLTGFFIISDSVC